jgi:hypothetical protein
MADINNSAVWSPVDASNNQSPPSGYPSVTMRHSDVEPTGRALMGAIRREWEYSGGVVTSTGTPNAYLVAYNTGALPIALVTGQTFGFIANFTNTGPATLQINGLAATSITRLAGTTLQAGDIIANSVVKVSYDGTRFQLLNAVAMAGTLTGNVTVNGFVAVNGLSPAVNSVSLNGALTGQAPQLQVYGSDANVGLSLITKGTGGVYISNGTQYLLGLPSTGTTGANFLTIYASSTGNPISLNATGTDANVSFYIVPKGAGAIGLIGPTNITGTVTASGVVNAGSFVASGSITGGGITAAGAITTTNSILASLDITAGRNMSVGGALTTGGALSVGTSLGVSGSITALGGGTFGAAYTVSAGYANFATQVYTATVYSTGDVIAYYSDARLKEKLRPILDSKAILNGLNGYRFNWNKIGQELTGKNSDEIGLVAQEVEKVLPQAVTLGAGGEFKTIKYDRIVPVLVESLKECFKEIEALKARLT